jgi:hypothetical protein
MNRGVEGDIFGNPNYGCFVDSGGINRGEDFFAAWLFG